MLLMPLNMVTSLLALWCLVLDLFSINRVWCLPVDVHGNISAPIKECSMEVGGPYNYVPWFQMGSKLLPSQGIIFILSKNNTAEGCTLNVTPLFQPLPLKSRLSELTFRMKCLSPLRVVYRRSENFSRVFVHSSLEVWGPCDISAKNLAVWGQATDLWSLRLHGVVLREDQNQTARDLEGLFNVGSLILDSLSSKGIPRMFTSFVWQKMAELRFTDISLTSIPDVLNQTMPNLQSLYLTHSRLQTPPNFPWCNTRLELPGNLSRRARWNQIHFTFLKIPLNPRMYERYLIVNYNPGLNVSKIEFMAGSLDKVSLSCNGLKYINPTILEKLTELKAIDLSVNKFNKIPAQIFRKVGGLGNINLANNSLEFLADGTFRELRELRKVDLSNNFIHTLQNGLLTDTENLEEIDLENNSLKNIEQRALPCVSNSIRKINLRRNSLRHIPLCAFQAPDLEVLDMSYNIMDDGSFLETLDSIEETYLTLSNSKFIPDVSQKTPKTPSKKILKLERNKIKHLHLAQFNGTRLLKLQLILKAYTLSIVNNPLMCDCKVGDLQSKLRDWTRTIKEITVDEFDSWVCHTPEDLRGTKVLSVPQDELKCKAYYPKCPAQCECYERPPGLPIFVDCRNRSLKEVPREVPEGLVELHLEGNQINNLIFDSSLKNVISLHVSHNKLRHFRLNYFSKLQEIFLDSNQLVTLPRNFQSMTFSRIDIRNNFFECDCKNKWMKKWLADMDRALAGGAVSVRCNSGKNRGKSLVSVEDDDFICTIESLKGRCARCPARCKCYKKSLDLPMIVDCRNRNLTEVPSKFPEGLVELRLEYNRIHSLALDNSLRNVTSLYLSHNIVRSITLGGRLPFELKEIFLDSNQLTSLPDDFRRLNLSKIDVRNNSFECNCENEWMNLQFR